MPASCDKLGLVFTKARGGIAPMQHQRDSSPAGSQDPYPSSPSSPSLHTQHKLPGKPSLDYPYYLDWPIHSISHTKLEVTNETYLDNLHALACELLRGLLRRVARDAADGPVRTHRGIGEDAFDD